MPKKPLTGTTKLTEAAQTQLAPESEGLHLVRRKPKTILKNFRLSAADVERLRLVTQAVSEESDRVISETAVIKGLSALGQRTNPARIFKLIKEVM